MIYLVKNKSGLENQVTKEMYDYLKGKKEYECRTIGAAPLQPIAVQTEKDPIQAEPAKKQEAPEYPIKDDNSSWYTLSNGRRVQGEEKAIKAQSEING